VFKLLVQGRRSTALFDGAHTTKLPLFSSEAAVPRARRSRIPALERALSELERGAAQPL